MTNVSCATLGHYGRLGNQMFQLAATVGLSKRWGGRWGYPHRNNIERSRISMYGETCILPKIFPSVEKANAWDDSWLDTGYCMGYAEPQDDLAQSFIVPTITKPTNVHGTPIDTLNIHGYFQSEEFFANAKDEVRNLFRFSDEVLDGAQEILDKTPGLIDHVGIHVRRGDYLKIKAVLPPLGWNYFWRAIREWGDYSKFAIFGCVDAESRAWALDTFVEKGYPVEFVGSVAGDPDIRSGIDMCLFSMLRGGKIISNSSFAWWGAWLGEGHCPKIVAPDTWFGPAGPKNNRLVPERWTKLRTE